LGGKSVASTVFAQDTIDMFQFAFISVCSINFEFDLIFNDFFSPFTIEKS